MDLAGHSGHQTPGYDEKSKVPGGTTAVVKHEVTLKTGLVSTIILLMTSSVLTGNCIKI